MHRRSFLPSSSGADPRAPSTSGPLPATASKFSLFRKTAPAPAPAPPASSSRDRRLLERAERARAESDGNGSVIDIAPHSGHGTPGQAARAAGGRVAEEAAEGEEEEERERARLREEAARSLGWGPAEAGAGSAWDAQDAAEGGAVASGSGSGSAERGEKARRGSFLLLPGKASKRHSIQALLARTPSRTAPAPSPPPVAPQRPGQPQQPAFAPQQTPAERLYTQIGPPPHFPSPLSAFPSPLHSSPVTFPSSPGLFGLRKPRPRLLLLSPQGQLHLFSTRSPSPKERESDRLDLLSSPAGSVTAVLLDLRAGGKKHEEHMLRVDGVSAGKGGGRTNWTFVCASRAEMGEWIRVVEGVLERARQAAEASPATAGDAQGGNTGKEAKPELLRPSLPGPTHSYPSAFVPETARHDWSSPSSTQHGDHVPPPPSAPSISHLRGKRQSLTAEALAQAQAARSHTPVSALPIGPKPRLSSRPSTAPTFTSFIAPPAAAGPPTVEPRDPAERDKRRDSVRASAVPGELGTLGQPIVRSPDSILSPTSPLSAPHPPLSGQQLGQHPFGASSTSLRDREVRESLPPPRRPRPGSVSGRPLSPVPSSEGSRLGAPSTREGGRTPEGAQQLLHSGSSQELKVSTANLLKSPRGTRTPKRPSTAPTISSPPGGMPATSTGSLKRRSGMLPPISPPPNHPIPAPPVGVSVPTINGVLPGSDVRVPKGERRLSAMAALPGPPTTNGTGGYVNGTRSRTGSGSGRTVRLLPDTPGTADLVGLGITSPNIQRRMTPPPRPPPTGALPALPIDTLVADEFGSSLRAQKHRSLPASPTQSSNPPIYVLPSQSRENVLGDSLIERNSAHDVDGAMRHLPEDAAQHVGLAGDKTLKAESGTRKKGESFFEGQSPDLDAVDTWDKPPRASSVLLGDDADRFWKEATRSDRPNSDTEGRDERPSQDSGELASTSTKTSFEAQPISYGTGSDIKDYERLGKSTPKNEADTIVRA
ncbi:hypothetical protein CALVIDRAFT_566420 [Calocera viscosa TUFC12733]|uniref:PH domain-containing protein n=1 Tax=Calocera viscosa (strain TUFC12733) TaxID=1330018 RepID=A0A167JL05_CALVF|nr:hypothetical protein CALVIDRAFT_566420 [Calocera viscosa TUFC12733]